MSENFKTKTYTRWVALPESSVEHYQSTGGTIPAKMHKTQQEAQDWIPTARVLYRQYDWNPSFTVMPVQVTRYTYPSVFFQMLREQWAGNASARFLLVVWFLALPAFFWGLVTTGTAMLTNPYSLTTVFGLGALILIAYGVGAVMDMPEIREKARFTEVAQAHVN